jgi:hypothetical protein
MAYLTIIIHLFMALPFLVAILVIRDHRRRGFVGEDDPTLAYGPYLSLAILSLFQSS